MVERQKAAVEFFISHQQFSESVEPTVRYLNDPASCLLPGVKFEFVGFLSAPFDMRDVSMSLNDIQRGSAGVACIRTQVLVRLKGGWGRLTTMPSSTASSCETSCRWAPVTTSDNGTPRPSTSK